MRLQMLALYDEKIGEFMTPFFAQSTGAAMRAVSDMVNESGDPPAKHPEDFSLHELGAFTSETGEFVMPLAPVLVCECVNLKRKGEA